MTGFLAISLDDEVAVAVHRRHAGVDPEIFETASTVTFAGDGTVSLGVEPTPGVLTVGAFVSQVGVGPDAKLGRLGGHRAEDLVAHAVNCLVAMVAARHGGVTPAVALACREGWGSDEHALLDAAFDRTGLHGVQLVSHNAAKGAYEAVAANGAPVSPVVGLAVGALVVLETGSDVADTDALPIVAQPPALAFSEAALVEPPAGSIHSRNRKPLVIVVAAALAGIALTVAIAASLGTFADGDAVTPPAITDAATPSSTVTTTPAPTPTVAAPFPTAPPAAPPAVDSGESAGSAPAARDSAPAPAPLPQPAPRLQPAPAPEVAPADPPSTRRTLPPRPTIPDFTYPTIPEFDRPGR